MLPSSYRVAVEEFMERRVVALAKGDGFQEVLVALDASTDAEYPVVESMGEMWDLGGHCHHVGWPASPRPCGGPSVSPHAVPMVSPQCTPNIPMLSPYHAHAVSMGCSCSVPRLLLWCPLIFPGCPVPIDVRMLCSQSCHGATSVFPCCPLGVPMPFPQYSHTILMVSLYCINAVPIPFGVPILIPR